MLGYLPFCLPPSSSVELETGVDVEVLLPGVGSTSVPEIVAVLAYGPEAFTVATIVKVALAPLAKFPILQFGALHVPVDGVALTKVYPAGKTSFTVTPVALLGPALLAVIVKVTLLPTFGVGLLTVLLTAKFVCGTGTGVDVEVLLPGVGSTSVPEIVAVLAYGPEAFTVATIVKVALAPLAKFPILQFGALHVPVDGVALTKVYPAGKTSFTVTPVALLGPALLAVMVKVYITAHIWCWVTYRFAYRQVRLWNWNWC